MSSFLDSSKVPGGMTIAPKAVGDLMPRPSADTPYEYPAGGQVIDSSSFGFRGAPRAGPLRVQAATSRYANTQPVRHMDDHTTTKTVAESGDDADDEEAPSPLKRMRENYLRESRERENRPPQVYRDLAKQQHHYHNEIEEESKQGHSDSRSKTSSIFDGDEVPPWVQKMDAVKDRKNMGPSDAPFDDAVSVGSTPPQKSASGNTALRLSAAGVLDAKRMKASSAAFRWLSGLGIVPPGEKIYRVLPSL